MVRGALLRKPSRDSSVVADDVEEQGGCQVGEKGKCLRVEGVTLRGMRGRGGVGGWWWLFGNSLTVIPIIHDPLKGEPRATSGKHKE